jgi:hypothetical protein
MSAISSKKTGTKGNAGCLIVVIAVICVVVAVAIGESIYHNNVLGVFKPEMQQYAAMGASTPGPSSELTRPMKVIVISCKDGDKSFAGDSLYFSLPEGMRAKNPQEVNTVVKLFRHETEVGTYTDGASAIRLSAEVAVVDMASNTTICDQTFWGSMPPDTKSGSGTGYGSSPDDDIVRYFEAFK